MTDGDEKYKLGELTADMAAVKGDVLEIKVTQKEIIKKLDNINAVSVERWEKRNSVVDKRFESIEGQLTILKTARLLENNSFFTRFRQKFADNSENIAVGLVLLIIVMAIAQYGLDRFTK